MPSEVAEPITTQYCGGKDNTLGALWNRLKRTKRKTQQRTEPDIFSPKGREWLSSHQISSCLTLLLHTKYRNAVHQAATGSAPMVCSDKMLKILLHDASQNPLPADAEFTKVLADSCLTAGPCPSIFIGDDQHFRNISINAKTSTIDLVDPLGNGFPAEVIQQVQDFHDKRDGKR